MNTIAIPQSLLELAACTSDIYRIGVISLQETEPKTHTLWQATTCETPVKVHCLPKLLKDLILAGHKRLAGPRNGFIEVLDAKDCYILFWYINSAPDKVIKSLLAHIINKDEVRAAALLSSHCSNQGIPEKAFRLIMESWVFLLEEDNEETLDHSKRVTALCKKVMEALKYSEDKIKYCLYGALLHDIGKLGVPRAILNKPGKLNHDEMKEVQRHVTIGKVWLETIPQLKQSMAIPLYHHEWWDGSGYPFGLKGQEIPEESRIFALVDVWDAITSDRVYRKAMTKEVAISEIISQKGKHFDPELCDLFIDLISEQNSL